MEMEPCLTRSPNVVVLDVNVFKLASDHVIDREGAATLVIFVGESRADDGACACREKLSQEHDFLRGGGEGHVLVFRGGESDDALKLVAP